jgi:signal transduction histidine kinase
VRVLAWLTAGAGIAFIAGGLLLNSHAGAAGDGSIGETLVFAPGLAATFAVGLLIAHRRPRNTIAWVLLLEGLALASMGIAKPWAGYVLLEDHAGPGGRLAGTWSEVSWPLIYAGPCAVAFLFPDGRLPSPRWRPVAFASAASFVLAIGAMFTWPSHMDPPFQAYTSPLAIEGIPTGLRVAAIVSLIFALAAGARAVYARFKRSEGVERLQLKWLVWAGLLIPATLLMCWIDGLLLGQAGILTGIGVCLLLVAIPVAVGIAVTRYRLYEIDRLINRTLVYVVLTALLLAAFTVVTVLVGTAAGQGSAVATAAATLAVAALFNPLRRRVQVWVDRRFNPDRYDALRRIVTFLEALRDGHAAPESTAAVLADALRDPTLELRYWLPSSELYVDASGRPVVDRPGDTRTRTEITRAGAPLGMVLYDPRLDERRDLLDSAVSAAGLAIEIARLRVEVNRQLAEVEDSRARIVSATNEERRRLERDLHDGAQQRLVTVGLALRHLQHELSADDDGPLRSQFDDAVAEIAAAIDDLRRIARGVRPPQLDHGLAEALRDLAAHSPLSVEVDVEPAGLEQLGDDVQTAAWYVASEALANAAKHSTASHVRLVARRDGPNLLVSVQDDGSGGAAPASGGGLAGLSDRVGAHGGQLQVASPPGIGTTITAELPCA